MSSGYRMFKGQGRGASTILRELSDRLESTDERQKKLHEDSAVQLYVENLRR